MQYGKTGHVVRQDRAHGVRPPREAERASESEQRNPVGGVSGGSGGRSPLIQKIRSERMASNGIRDRVAIVGMGCTPFGEHWDKSASDLLVDATGEALTSAGIELRDVDAFWLGTLFSGQSGLTLSRPLKIDYKPVSRLENYCATGSEAFRNACYAVASGAYDVAMAIGVEKLEEDRKSVV